MPSRSPLRCGVGSSSEPVCAKRPGWRGTRISRGVQDLQLVAQPLFGFVSGEFGGAKFAGGDVHVGEPDQRAGRARGRRPPENCFRLGSRTCRSVAVPGVITRTTSRRTSFFPGPGCSIWSHTAIL